MGIFEPWLYVRITRGALLMSIPHLGPTESEFPRIGPGIHIFKESSQIILMYSLMPKLDML